jgi:hypothetical protein
MFGFGLFISLDLRYEFEVAKEDVRFESTSSVVTISGSPANDIDEINAFLEIP